MTARLRVMRTVSRQRRTHALSQPAPASAIPRTENEISRYLKYAPARLGIVACGLLNIRLRYCRPESMNHIRSASDRNGSIPMERREKRRVVL